MGRIYRNLKEIPIPEGGKVCPSDQKVSIYSYINGRRTRREIGLQTSPGMMVPNDNFRIDFPLLWNQYYPSLPSPQPKVSVGNYAVSLAIGWKTGLYPDLQSCLGPYYGNAVMDFARYMIRERASSAQLFADDMQGQLFFCGKPMSDAWYSDLFAHQITAPMIHAFRDAWLRRCAEMGMGKIWLCIDGSNNDCMLSESALADPGHAKSGKDVPIISYIWAVDAQSRRPITWFVNNGGMPDCKALDEVIRYLAESKLDVEGIIVDRGFATKDVLDLAVSRGLDYIVMLKSNCAGYTSMMERHADEIRDNAKFLLKDDFIFGTTDNVKVFAGNDEESCVALFYSPGRKYHQGRHAVEKIFDAEEAAQKQMKRDPGKVSIPKDVAQYLTLQIKDGVVVEIVRNVLEIQKLFDLSGYHAIASAEPRSALDILRLYRLRDGSEKQFSQLKSQLNSGVLRVQSDQAVESRFFTAFVASILRTEIMLSAQELGIRNTNTLIRDLDRAYLRRLPNGRYEAVRNHSEHQSRLFGRFNLVFESFQQFAEEVQRQADNSDNTQVRRIPHFERRGPGRPKGSTNKKPDTAQT